MVAVVVEVEEEVELARVAAEVAESCLAAASEEVVGDLKGVAVVVEVACDSSAAAEEVAVELEDSLEAAAAAWPLLAQ